MGYLLPLLILVWWVFFCFFFVFSADDEEEPGDCRIVPVTPCDFCGGWIRTLGPVTVQLRDAGW